MLSPSLIGQQINQLVACLVETGLAGDQNFSCQRTLSGNRVSVTFPNDSHINVAMKDRPYDVTYNELVHARAYNARMPDGAIIQMMYAFVDRQLERHRLAFLPSPHLDEFQNYPELYSEDEVYADVIAKSVVPFPVRFDFDGREDVCKEVEHPKSHLTLGQYQNCRIPVTAPLTPVRFVDFVLRNFYHTAFEKYADRLPIFTDSFGESIFAEERCLVHVVIPK